MNDELTFDLNLYNTELKVFKKQSAVADYRLGDDGDAIGVYNFSINKSEAIVNGAIPDKDALVRAVTNALDESVNAEALVDEAIDYLAKSQGKFDKNITKKELFEVLGIDGSTPNVVGLKVKLQKGKTTAKKKNAQGEITHDVGITTLNRVLGKKASRPILRKKAETQDAIDRAELFAKETGILVGISSGANILASERWAIKNKPSGIVVTMLCDRGERYMSIYDS